jgi:hypothetical protein
MSELKTLALFDKILTANNLGKHCGKERDRPFLLLSSISWHHWKIS